jgi:CDP-glucose 4,6-dehydratase
MSDLPRCFADAYRGRTVLVTGHTGFKGSWLALWLRELGARVVGFSHPPPTRPSHFDLLGLDMESAIGDVREPAALTDLFRRAKPEAVFHLAAQPLVRRSYREPAETFTSNVVGTLNVFEAARAAGSVRAIVSITSDKVYENLESDAGYVETDRLGGSDPYSCSKACCELLTSCYRQSYLPNAKFGKDHHTLLASVRAGNVIGGGDWAEDRLLPDAVRAAVTNEPLRIRSPRSVRPWQHVLEPLAGYLLVGQKLLEKQVSAADAWNFGPEDEGNVEVETVAGRFREVWPKLRVEVTANPSGPHETKVLKLDSGKAKRELGWRPVWGWREAVGRAADWYRRQHEEGAVASRDDLRDYVAAARRLGLGWAGA